LMDDEPEGEEDDVVADAPSAVFERLDGCWYQWSYDPEQWVRVTKPGKPRFKLDPTV
jgi:hypothetical protein